TQEIWRGLNQASPMRRCRLYLRLWLTRCLRGSRLYPAPAASWKLLHCSFVTRPAARSALARSSPGRHRLVCRGPPALPPPSCFLLAPQTTTAAASPKPFSGAAPPRKNAPSRRQERALLRSEEHTSELQSPDQHPFPTRRSSDLTRPAARSALARSSPGRHRLVCRGPPALPPPSCFLLAPQTTTAAASPKPFSGAAPPRKNAPSRRQERALL